MILTLRRLCIVIYSCNKSQGDALFLKFILVKNSTCFGQICCPSSGVLILYSQQLLFVILIMLTVCQQGQDGTLNLSETCRVLYQNKFEKQCISLAFITTIYHDAQPSECQNHFSIKYPSLSIEFFYLYVSRSIPVGQNYLLKRRGSLRKLCLSPSSSTNGLPRSVSFRGPQRWKSEGPKSLL